MSVYSQATPTSKVDDQKEFTVRTVLNLYGVFLFLGLMLSIFTHEIEDANGYLLFLLVSSALYFLMLNLYFISELGRTIVFGMMGTIALISLFIVFYL